MSSTVIKPTVSTDDPAARRAAALEIAARRLEPAFPHGIVPVDWAWVVSRAARAVPGS